MGLPGHRPRTAAWRTALGAAILSTSLLAAAPAYASTGDPGGIEAPTSPGGIPAGGVGPEYHTFLLARSHSDAGWGTQPRGSNDFGCRPKAGQSPIVLVPGTGEDAFATWSFYSPHLAAAGYCVFTFNYNPSVNAVTGETNDSQPFSGDIRQSAAFLGTFVDRVLASTGANRVTLIGHSQGGGPLPRAYLQWYGGAAKVNHLIALVPSNHGTSAYGVAKLYQAMTDDDRDFVTAVAEAKNVASLYQQLTGSELLTSLNAGGETMPGVKYTVLTTRWDQVVLPYTSAYLSGDNVTNIKVQDICPLDGYNHLNFTYDPVAYQLVTNALDPANARQVNCWWVPPYLR